MSTVRRQQAWTVPVIEDIECTSQENLRQIEKTVITWLEQKLDKLKILFKNMEIYQGTDCIVVNDQYSMCPTFEKIAKSFGLCVEKYKTKSLNGDSYILADPGIGILKLLGSEYQYGSNLSDLKTNMSINPNFNCRSIVNSFDEKIRGEKNRSHYLREIYGKGSAKVNGTEHFIDGVSQGITSNKYEVENSLRRFTRQIEEQISVENKHMQEGTKELITYRAKQIGYTVKEEIVNNQVQLVLVKVG